LTAEGSHSIRRLAGKVVLVTGAAGGFGRAIEHRLLSEGARLVCTDIAPIASSNDQVLALHHDVTSESSWNDAVEAALARFGGIDVVVNNAGVPLSDGPQDPEHVSLEHWRKIHVVNVEGVLLGCQAAIRVMKNTGGAIVNISSLAALNPSPKMAAYGASKAAVRHLTRTVAAYCAQNGYAIRCNSIHPGWFPTEMVRRSRTPEELAAQERAIPIGRFGEPSEVAAGVAYLSSDDAAYVTGAKLVIDGGVAME
jgi:3(or 17)beta-hydroxysteroid dehydrogenase